MIRFSVFVCVLFLSCLPGRDTPFNPHKEIQGDWLILYPQHILKTDDQRKLYGLSQDSIVNLLGLKLVRFATDGKFIQSDSLFGKHGVWRITDTARLDIRDAGKGFENFKGKVVRIRNDTILIEELVKIRNENIKLIWHLKKITSGSDAEDLFKKENNLWRQRPVNKEVDKEIRERVISMLNYYALYFKVVSKESIYFSPGRVFLPFNYYQHGVGLTGFSNDFVKCFFDRADAEKGYRVIQDAFENSQDLEFPSGENYVIEYSEYFSRLARLIN